MTLFYIIMVSEHILVIGIVVRVIVTVRIAVNIAERRFVKVNIFEKFKIP